MAAQPFGMEPDISFFGLGVDGSSAVFEPGCIIFNADLSFCYLLEPLLLEY